MKELLSWFKKQHLALRLAVVLGFVIIATFRTVLAHAVTYAILVAYHIFMG